ncbi:MAG: PKD domain-containing protein [Bacteroidia bacterium]|nr:PKD domain-containing protein [Bacteroidia bacterium]
MEQANIPQNRFEEYLEKIEAREKSRRRKTNLKWFLLLAFMGTGFVVYQQSGVVEKTPEFRKFAIADLDPDLVNGIFAQESEPIIVYHPEIGNDTVTSINDYYQVLNVIDLIEMGRKAYTDMEKKTTDSTSMEPLQTFIVDVAGERQIKRKLIFTIEDYNEEIEYELDFGNGVTKAVKDRTVYSYPLPGHFDLTLKATSKDGRSSKYVKKYEILSGETPVNLANNN